MHAYIHRMAVTFLALAQSRFPGKNTLDLISNSLYSSPNIVRLRWAGHVARMGEGRGEVFTGFWLGGPKVRDPWKDLGVGGKITLRRTLGR
jgi:hypothetical protein